MKINRTWESISFITWILEPLTSSKLNHAQVEENLSIRTQMLSHIRTNTYMCTRICHYSKRIFQQVINTSSWIWYSIDTRNLVMSTTQKSRLLFNDCHKWGGCDFAIKQKHPTKREYVNGSHHILLMIHFSHTNR